MKLLTGNVWKPTEAGAKRKPAAWMNGPKLPTVHTPPQPKARRDRDVLAYGARVEKAITDDTLRAGEYIGSASDGWRLVHTDGHRAILLRGQAEAGKVFPAVIGKWPVQQLTLEPEVFNIIKRMMAAGGARKPYVRLELDADSETSGRLTFSTKDLDDFSTTASEWIDVTGVHLQRADLLIDPRYLLDALGLWPAVLRLGGPGDAAWICTDESRYCLMPMNGGHQDIGIKIHPYEIASEVWALHPSTATASATAKRIRKSKAQRASEAAAAAVIIDAAINAPAQVAAPSRPTAVPRATARRATVNPPPATDAPTGVLTAGQKAAATRAARIAAGLLTIDYHAAARKAVETRQARRAA